MQKTVTEVSPLFHMTFYELKIKFMLEITHACTACWHLSLAMHLDQNGQLVFYNGEFDL